MEFGLYSSSGVMFLATIGVPELMLTVTDPPFTADIFALELVDRLNSEGYDAYHAEILIENAVNDADLIIAPDGISGNLIFRTMHLIGGALALGAPVINIDKVFIDTSRAKKDYKDSIALAMRLTEGKK